MSFVNAFIFRHGVNEKKRYALFLSIFFFFLSLTTLSFAESGFLEIGDPLAQGLTQAQSTGQVLFISLHAYSCGDTINPKQKPHPICGQAPLQTVFKQTGTMRENSDKVFTSTKNILLSFTRPEVTFGKKGYSVKPKAEARKVSLETRVKVTLSKEIKKNVLASVVVTEDRMQRTELMAYYDDLSFVNPVPVPYRRMMTGRQRFKLGETHTITGALWVETPSFKETDPLRGEKERLYLEMTLK